MKRGPHSTAGVHNARTANGSGCHKREREKRRKSGWRRPPKLKKTEKN
jgi:hypothetical protein